MGKKYTMDNQLSDNECGKDNVTKKKFRDELGERMKEYEKDTTSQFLRGDLPWIVRLDGHHFSKFTRGFTKPFDQRLANAMIKTCCDLLTEFGPSLVYTQSDEITMVFPPLPQLLSPSPSSTTVETSDVCQKQEQKQEKKQEQRQQPFGGKISKITTLMASFCAVRFNFHIQAEQYNSNTEDKLSTKVKLCQAYFDARAFNVPSKVEAVNNILWRSYVDCRRNSVINLGHTHFSPKQMHGVSTSDVYDKLLKLGVDWNRYPSAYKYGTFAKKNTIQKSAIDLKTGEQTIVTRTQVQTRSFDLDGFHTTHENLLFAKYWSDYDSQQ